MAEPLENKISGKLPGFSLRSLRQGVIKGAERSPTETANDIAISSRIRQPLGVVGPSNRNELDKQGRIVELTNKFAETNVLKRHITKNAPLSSLIQDDVDNSISHENIARNISFANSMFGGVNVLKGLGWRAVESMSEFTEEEEEIELRAARAAQAAFDIVPPTMRIEDADSPGAFWDWMRSNAGQQLPLMVPGLVGATAGTYIGGVIGTAIAPGPGTVIGAAIGNRLGSFIPSFILGMGEVQQSIREISPDIERPDIVLAGGALIGALDSLLPGKVGRKLVNMFGQKGAQDILQLTVRNILKRSAVAGAKGMGVEGITESIQEAISVSAAALATETEIDVPALASDMLNAFAVGAFMGGSIGTTVSASSDLIKARRQQKVLKALNKIAAESKLKGRSREEYSALVGAYIRDGGVNQFIVNTDMLLWWAEQQPDPAILEKLQVNDQLDNPTVVLSPETFAAYIIGVEGYNELIKFVTTVDGRSMESVSRDFSRMEVIEKIGIKLGEYPISEGLREKVLKTLQKFQTEDAMTVFDTMPQDVETIINALYSEVEVEDINVEGIILRGRLDKIDSDIDAKNKAILALERSIEVAEKEKKGTIRLEKALAKTIAEVDDLLEQQAAIVNIPEAQDVVLQEAETIVGATFQIQGVDETFVGANHVLAIEKAEEKLGQETVDTALDTLGATEEGFITSLGRILSREEAGEEFGVQVSEDIGSEISVIENNEFIRVSNEDAAINYAERIGYDEVKGGRKVFGDVRTSLIQGFGLQGEPINKINNELNERGFTDDLLEKMDAAYRKGREEALTPGGVRAPGPLTVNNEDTLIEIAIELYQAGNLSGFSEPSRGDDANSLMNIIDDISRIRADTPYDVARDIRKRAGISLKKGDLGFEMQQKEILLEAGFTSREIRKHIKDGEVVEFAGITDQERDINVAMEKALEASEILIVPVQRAAPLSVVPSEIEARDAVLKSVAKKPIIISKAKILSNLAVKVNTQMVRLARKAFSVGLKSAKTLEAKKQALIKVVGALPLHPKQKLAQTKRISAIQSLAQFKRVVPLLRARLDNLLVVAHRSAIIAAIRKQTDKTAVKGKEGKFNPEVQEYLDEIRHILSLPKKTLREKQDIEATLNSRLEALDANPDEAWKNMLYSLILGDSTVSLIEAENFLIDIVKLREQGRAASMARINTRRMRIAHDAKTAAHAVLQGKEVEMITTAGLAARLRDTIQAAGVIKDATISAWADLLDIAFNKEGVDARALIEHLLVTDEIGNWKEANLKWERRFLDDYSRIYGTKGDNQALNKMQDDSVPREIGVFQDANGRSVRLTVSVAEIRKIYMESLDPELNKVLRSKTGNAYTEQMMAAMWARLDNEGLDKQFALAQLTMYREFYGEINKVYRERYGVNLPFTEFYSPITRDKGMAAEGESTTFGSEETILGEFAFRRTVPKALLRRKKNEIALGRQNDIGVMYQHLHNLNWFIHVSAKVLHIKNVFKDEVLKNAIEAKHGKGFLRNINGFIDDFAVGHIKKGSELDKWISKMNRRFTESKLALKPTIGVKQIVSWFAMGDNIPGKDFLKYQAEFLANPRKIITFLYKNSAGVQVRGNSLEFELAQIGTVPKNIFNIKHQTTWNNIAFAFIRLGDRLPIFGGGWAVYQHAIASGKTHAQAIKLFERTFNDTQQSVDIDQMSALQRSYAIGRSMTMFMTSRLALLRVEMRAWRHSPMPLVGRKKISWFEFGKRIGYLHIYMPLLIQWVSSGFRWETDRQIAAMVLGQLNGFVLLGELLLYTVLDIISDEKRYDIDQNIPLIAIVNDIRRGIYDLATSDWETEKVLDAMNDLGSVTGDIIGKPIGTVMNALGGLGDIEDREIEKGMKRVFGYSEKVAEESSEYTFF